MKDSYYLVSCAFCQEYNEFPFLPDSFKCWKCGTLMKRDDTGKPPIERIRDARSKGYDITDAVTTLRVTKK